MSTSDPFSFSKPKWDIVQDKKVYETPVFSLHEIKLIPDQKNTTVDFFVLDAPEWINVIALTPENEILLVEQYRAGIDQSSLEIPGGIVDENEDPLDAAKRELAEETGFTSEYWTKIGKASSNPAILNNYIHLYFAIDCIKTGQQEPDGTEDILVHQIPLKDFFDLIKNGTVHHAIVLAAVTHLLLMDK
ncbi:MAG: NUDIX hydrolase [Balneolaceae bacterium]